jgi:hypothetical protein
VRAALLAVFSNRRLANGTLGFFHDDKLSFGQGIYVSQLIATAMAVEGVETARVNCLRRLYGRADDALSTGVLALGAMEVARLDGDPNFPENGRLDLTLRGGR